MSIKPLQSSVTRQLVLTINAGSSSLKSAVFELADLPRRLAKVTVERIGSDDAILTESTIGQATRRQPTSAATIEAGLDSAVSALQTLVKTSAFIGIGHRVVHGGPNYSAAQLASPPLLEELRKLEAFDPEHLPAQIRLIEVLQKRMPGIPQVACFDTAFHQHLPIVARRLPIPRKFDSIGVRRYGFHGLSYSYLMEELRRISEAEANGRVILAHLGNGASLAAVREGHPIDTSMCFTPAAGVPMGTRSGDLDPGLIDYLFRVGQLTVEDFNRIVHLESGLLGISETTSDMQQLLELATTDVRAEEAVDIFCYQVQKWIGAYAAALGGLDTLVFAGGIGERAPEIRRRVCSELRFLGIELDAMRNDDNSALVSTGNLHVNVRVIDTSEEQIIARDVIDVVSRGTAGRD